MSISGSGCEILNPVTELKTVREIEKSIIKKYRKEIWTKFIKAIKEYNLVEDGDKIAVAISGGKDSLLLAKLFQELKRHGQVNFEVEYIGMDPGFNELNRSNFEKNCKHLEIPIKIKNSQIFEVVENISKQYPCYLCAKMRRGFLYSYAQELGCNKVALGHHFDDVIETTLLNVLYGGSFKTMLPKLKSTNYEGMELIRPLFLVREDSIKKFTVNNGLLTMNCGCVVAAGKTSSKRDEMKTLIKDLKKVYKDVDKSIFQSANNVFMESILGWRVDGEKVDYLDEY